MSLLTSRQQDVLRFIIGFQEAKGFSPCLREIALGIGISPKSKARVRDAVLSLQDRGFVRVLAHRERAIEVLHPIPIPRAPDGTPLFQVPEEAARRPAGRFSRVMERVA
jgi:SOS-response transcriptional repressor LexA